MLGKIDVIKKTLTSPSLNKFIRRKERKTEAFENVRGEAAKYKSIFKTRNMRLAFPKT